MRLLILVFTIIYINNMNSDININNLKSIKINCNDEAYKITNNYDLFNHHNNYNNYEYYDININNKTELKEIIIYNKIRLNCINKEEKEIINNMIITYMALFGLCLVIYI